MLDRIAGGCSLWGVVTRRLLSVSSFDLLDLMCTVPPEGCRVKWLANPIEAALLSDLLTRSRETGKA